MHHKIQTHVRMVCGGLQGLEPGSSQLGNPVDADDGDDSNDNKEGDEDDIARSEKELIRMVEEEERPFEPIEQRLGSTKQQQHVFLPSTCNPLPTLSLP